MKHGLFHPPEGVEKRVKKGHFWSLLALFGQKEAGSGQKEAGFGRIQAALAYKGHSDPTKGRI